VPARRGARQARIETLLLLVGRTMPRLGNSPRHRSVAARNPGLLARYQQLDLLVRLRDRIGRREVRCMVYGCWCRRKVRQFSHSRRSTRPGPQRRAMDAAHRWIQNEHARSTAPLLNDLQTSSHLQEDLRRVVRRPEVETPSAPNTIRPRVKRTAKLTSLARRPIPRQLWPGFFRVFSFASWRTGCWATRLMLRSGPRWLRDQRPSSAASDRERPRISLPYSETSGAAGLGPLLCTIRWHLAQRRWSPIC
jgi:hypothetical protein